MRNLTTNTSFMLLWSFGSIVSIFGGIVVGSLIFMAGGFIAMSIFGEEMVNLSPVAALIFLTTLFSAIGLAIGLLFGSIQKAILRMRTNEPWRGWLIASAIGGVLGVDAIAALLITQGAGYLMWMIVPPAETLFWWGFQAALIFYGCFGLSQMFALSQYIRGAWVWILANLVAGVVLFSLLAFGAIGWATTSFFAMLMVFLISAAPGFVTSFAMVWLINTNWRQGY